MVNQGLFYIQICSRRRSQSWLAKEQQISLQFMKVIRTGGVGWLWPPPTSSLVGLLNAADVGRPINERNKGFRGIPYIILI